MGTGFSGGGNSEAVSELVNSRLGGPSEAGNAKVAEAAASFGRVNKNPRSKEFSGTWSIVYASGNTGLTALDGKISKFTITDGTYENECDSKIAGIFPGKAKEGGKLKVTGGTKFELVQEYREFSRPGGTSYEEVEDAPVRGFEVLALTDNALVMRLAATTFLDEDTNKRVTQVPEGDYFLVWRKQGAAPAAVAPPAQTGRAVQEAEEEEVQRTASGSIFSGLFGGSSSSASLATVAEKNLGGGSGRAQALEAQRAAAETSKQAAMDRKAAAVDRKAAALADKERRREEAAARKQEMLKRTQQDLGDGTEVVTKPLFAFGGFGGNAKKADQAEPVEKTTGVSVKGGLGSLFGSQKSKKRESAAAKSSAPAGNAAAQKRTEAEAKKREAIEARERAKQEAEEKKEAARQEAEAKKRAAAEEREQKRLEAEAKKQDEATKREAEADMRRRINDILADMQSDTRDAALEVREQTMQLKTAERSGQAAMRAGGAAEKQVAAAESAFTKAESDLAAANEAFNDIAGKLRAKQNELNATRNEAKQLENNLLKKV